jgi:hypothetical protein
MTNSKNFVFDHAISNDELILLQKLPMQLTNIELTFSFCFFVYVSPDKPETFKNTIESIKIELEGQPDKIKAKVHQIKTMFSEFDVNFRMFIYRENYYTLKINAD